MKKFASFTLVEILLTVALMTGVLTIISLPSVSLLNSNKNQIIKTIIIKNLRSAEIKALYSHNDRNWSVKITNNKVTVFTGTSYLLRDQEEDQVTFFPSEITGVTVDEIVFAKYSGIPNISNIISFVSSKNSQTTTIEINEIDTVTN